MSNKADFYTNKILSNLNGEIKYYTGNVLVKGQRVKGATYSNLSKLSEKAKQKLFSKIEKVLKERGLAYKNIERYKYDKEAFLKEWAQEELMKYEEKIMNKYGDINSLESMDEYLSQNNKTYASTIEGLAAIYGADSETFLEHKENAINHFKQELVQKVEAGKEKILNKADKDFNKSASLYLKFDRKREFILSKLNEKVTQLDEFAKEKETGALEDLKAKQEEQDLNKKAHDYRVEKLGELGEKAIDNTKKAAGKTKDIAVDAATMTLGAGVYVAEGAVKVAIDAKNIGKEKVKETTSKFKDLGNDVLNKTSNAKNKLLGLVEKSKTGIMTGINHYKDKTKEYVNKFGGFVKDTYVESKTKIGKMANKVKSSVSKERINEIKENSFLSNLNIRERLGKVKNKVTGLGIKGKSFAISAVEIAKNTDYSKFFKGGIKEFKYDGENLVFNVAPGKLGKMGKVKWGRQVHIPMVYDEVTQTYLIDYDNKEIFSKGGGFNNEKAKQEEKNIEEMVSSKLGTIDKNELKNYGEIVEIRKKDDTGRNFIQYVDSKSGSVVFVAKEYTTFGLNGEEIRKYRCQKTLDGIPELEGLEPKGMLDIGEIDEKAYAKQMKLFRQRSKELESENKKEEREKSRAAKRDKNKENEIENDEVENEVEMEKLEREQLENDGVVNDEVEDEVEMEQLEKDDDLEFGI